MFKSQNLSFGKVLTPYQTTNFKIGPNLKHLQMTDECKLKAENIFGMG